VHERKVVLGIGATLGEGLNVIHVHLIRVNDQVQLLVAYEALLTLSFEQTPL